MYNDIQKKLVTEEQLKTKVKELGKKITEDYNGEEVLVSIPDEEKEIVLNFYNAFKNSILEGGNE